MINEISGAKINFRARKESDLERKVRKLEKDMMDLDSILNKEKLVRSKSMENQQTATSDETILHNYRSFQDMPNCMAQGDRPDSWQGMPIHIHHCATSTQVQPAFFFTWDCTPNDFHNKNAQRSIYTVLDQLKPRGQSVSAENFKKQLSALLAANKESVSTTDLAMGHYHVLGDKRSNCEKLSTSTCKPKADTQDIKKPDLETKNSDLDIKINKSDEKIPDLETRELLANLEKKLKQVESKCRGDAMALTPFNTNETNNEDKVVDSDDKKSEEIDQDSIIIDDLIFEMFQDSNEEFEKKPIELVKEVDGLLKSYQQVGDPLLQTFKLEK